MAYQSQQKHEQTEPPSGSAASLLHSKYLVVFGERSKIIKDRSPINQSAVNLFWFLLCLDFDGAETLQIIYSDKTVFQILNVFFADLSCRRTAKSPKKKPPGWLCRRNEPPCCVNPTRRNGRKNGGFSCSFEKNIDCKHYRNYITPDK